MLFNICFTIYLEPIFLLISELFVINVPLLIIRSYIAVHFDDFISVFLVKNILAILFGIVEIYDCCYDRYEERKEEELESQSNEDETDDTEKLTDRSSDAKLHDMQGLSDDEGPEDV